MVDASLIAVAHYMDEARTLVLSSGRASISFIQRRMQISYTTAARIMVMLEAEGVVSAPDIIGKREILSTALSVERPGDRERLGNASPSEDEVPAGSAPREGDLGSGQSSRLADTSSIAPMHPDLNQSKSAPVPASATSDEMAIPTFLRRGHSDCLVESPPRQEEPSADA